MTRIIAALVLWFVGSNAASAATIFDCSAIVNGVAKYANLNACLDAAKTFVTTNESGSGLAAEVWIPNGVQSINPAVAALTLTAAGNASAGSTVYTGTITGGGSNAFAGLHFYVTGFDNTANNGDFIATASTASSLTLTNASGVADTHAASAMSPYALNGGMQIKGIAPRVASTPPPQETFTFNGGTIIDCGGVTNECFAGSNLHGIAFNDIGFQDFGKAATFGGNGVVGLLNSVLHNIYCIGSATNNISSHCIQLFNSADMDVDGYYTRYVNTGFSFINQYAGTNFGNSSFNHMFLNVYPKSTAIGNNGTCGLQIATLAPVSGTPGNVNGLTFTHFEVLSFNSNGSTEDGTGFNRCIDGISGHNNTAVVFVGSDIESNGNTGTEVSYTTNSYFGETIDVANANDFVLNAGVFNNTFNCTSQCKFSAFSNFQNNLIVGNVNQGYVGSGNPFTGFFVDINSNTQAALSNWNSLLDGYGQLLYGLPTSTSTTSCTLSQNPFSGCLTAGLGDCNQFAQFTSNSAITVTVPSTLPPGCYIVLEQEGAGTITVAAGSGASVHANGGLLATRAQYDMLYVKIGTVAGAARVSFGQ